MTFTVTEHEGPAGPWRVAGIEQGSARPLQVAVAVTRATPNGPVGVSWVGTVTADGLTFDKAQVGDPAGITAALRAANLHQPAGAATLLADAAQAGRARIVTLRTSTELLARSRADWLSDRVACLDRLVAALSLADRDQRVAALAVVGSGFTGTPDELATTVTAATARWADLPATSMTVAVTMAATDAPAARVTQ